MNTQLKYDHIHDTHGTNFQCLFDRLRASLTTFLVSSNELKFCLNYAIIIYGFNSFHGFLVQDKHPVKCSSHK